MFVGPIHIFQKIKTEGKHIRGCSLLPDGRMVISCSDTNTVSFINKEGVELFQIGKNKTGNIGGDRSATIIWACFSFLLRKVNSQGIYSTTTSPNF
jgi:hypothetical protein